MNELFQYEKLKKDFRDIALPSKKKIPLEIIDIITSYGNIHPIHPIAKKFKKKINKCSSCFGSAFFLLPFRKRFAQKINEKNYVKTTSVRVIYDYIKIYKSDEYRNKIGKLIYDVQMLIIGRAIRNRI